MIGSSFISPRLVSRRLFSRKLVSSSLLNRREVLQGVGGLTLLFTLAGSGLLGDANAALPRSLAGTPDLNAWLKLNADGTVTIFTGKVELGQGITTPLAQIAADELDVDIERVSIITADTSLTPDEFYTFGSISIQQSGSAIRYAAAEARAIMLAHGARHLGISQNNLSIADGSIGNGSRSVSYWQLLEAIDLKREATGNVKPKTPEQRRYAGKSVPRIDVPDKVFAQPSYIQDLKLANMLHGRIVRPPQYEAKLLSFDHDGTMVMAGVKKIVRDGSFLGVIADQEYRAIEASQYLASSAVWSEVEGVENPADLSKFILGQEADISILKSSGFDDLSEGGISACYSRAFQAHASISPSAALAQFENGRLKLWCHSQGIFPLRRAISEVIGLSEDDIHIIHLPASGCYGHNGADDAALDAVLLARAMPSTPIRLQWMREDEFMWEPFGSAMAIEVSGSVDDNGVLGNWLYDVYGFPHSSRPSGGGGNLLAAQHLENPITPPPANNIPQPNGGLDRNAISPYRAKNGRVTEHFIPSSPLRTGSLRALGAYANVFAIESFMDELAHSASLDPVEFRIEHLDDTRARDVVREAALRSGWGQGLSSSSDVKRGRGIAYSRYKGSGGYLAVVAEVAVNVKTGEIKVERAISAVDCGEVINPDGVINQVEGGIIQSTSWTLMEEVGFDKDGITSTDWSGYPILGFLDAPKVEVCLMERAEQPPLGSGEVAQGPMAGAISNAVFDAAGIRLRDIPFTTDKVLAALA